MNFQNYFYKNYQNIIIGDCKSNNIKNQLNTVFLSKILKFYFKNTGEKW